MPKSGIEMRFECLKLAVQLAHSKQIPVAKIEERAADFERWVRAYYQYDAPEAPAGVSGFAFVDGDPTVTGAIIRRLQERLDQSEQEVSSLEVKNRLLQNEVEDVTARAHCAA